MFIVTPSLLISEEYIAYYIYLSPIICDLRLHAKLILYLIQHQSFIVLGTLILVSSVYLSFRKIIAIYSFTTYQT